MSRSPCPRYGPGTDLDKDDQLDRDLESLSASPAFNWRRLWVALLASAAIITAASLLVRAYPNSGYQAGYDAAIGVGKTSVQAEVDSANGTALPLCQELHAASDSSPSAPRYDYDSFIKGCGAAVEHLYGKPVPLLPAE